MCFLAIQQTQRKQSLTAHILPSQNTKQVVPGWTWYIPQKLNFSLKYVSKKNKVTVYKPNNSNKKNPNENHYYRFNYI